MGVKVDSSLAQQPDPSMPGVTVTRPNAGRLAADTSGNAPEDSVKIGSAEALRIVQQAEQDFYQALQSQFSVLLELRRFEQKRGVDLTAPATARITDLIPTDKTRYEVLQGRLNQASNMSTIAFNKVVEAHGHLTPQQSAQCYQRQMQEAGDLASKAKQIYENSWAAIAPNPEGPSGLGNLLNRERALLLADDGLKDLKDDQTIARYAYNYVKGLVESQHAPAAAAADHLIKR